MAGHPHWADVLTLREEIVSSEGHIGDLQMSLYSAVYADHVVPYRDARYYSEITEPTAGLISFMARIARRLGAQDGATRALFHLDQGMGGGKSHALVGLYHLANEPEAFLSTALGQRVLAEAQERGEIDLADTKVVILSADNMTPGAPSPEFGPARTLHERFLWSLVDGDPARYEAHRSEGPNKAALQRALATVGRPVLILLDEVMDYVLQLSDRAHLADMPGEQAFVSALMDATDEVPRVAFVVVMIRSEFDERGYTVEAESFRDFMARRIERNGETVAVTEAADFAAILQRRLFATPDAVPPIDELAASWREAAGSGSWWQQVFERLPPGRGLAGFRDRAAAAYPFHPDLMALVRDDWSRHAGFQRVRSTVAIFALAAYYWICEYRAGRWAPDLIGVGDLPIRVVLEPILSSGLLHGSERAIQGFRQVASTDVITRDGSGGRARDIDAELERWHLRLCQPAAAVRIATALYCYSLVPRDQARRGATKPELLSSAFVPGAEHNAAEEVFNLLTDDDGLGALETTTVGEAAGLSRYRLSIQQTPQMFYRQAKATVQPADRDGLIWDRARSLTTQGPFDVVLHVDQGDQPGMSSARVFAEVDQNSRTRLVVLDPRRWTLLNGHDTPTRTEIQALLGVGPDALHVDCAASCVVACVNTQRREEARKRAMDFLAWALVVPQLEGDPERQAEAMRARNTSSDRLDREVRRAFQHYAFLVRGADQIDVDWRRFDADDASALGGNRVWDALADAGRATTHAGVSGDYLAALLDRLGRPLTLKEVVQQFYRNPVFPMVRSADEIRAAILELTRAGWEVAGPDGNPLDIQRAADLSIGSMDQVLRRRAEPTAGAIEYPVLQPHTPVDGRNGSGISDRPPQATPSYRRASIRLASKSLVSAEGRRQATDLAWALFEAIDPDHGHDVQLLDLSVSVTADQAAFPAVEQAARRAGATYREEDDEFA